MKKKLIPTWLKIAGLAVLVPYQIEVKKDEGKLKKIRLRSLALQLSYTAPENGEKAKIDGVVPGFNADKVKDTEGNTHKVDTDELFDQAFSAAKHAAHEVKEAFDEAFDELDDDFDDITADIEKFVN